MPTVALITSQYALTSPVDADRELPLIVRALTGRGVTCRVVDWLDETARYDDVDLVVIKSPWDYASRWEEFLAWLARVEAVAPVANHPEVVRWNLDKAYLGELRRHGVPACPTSYCGSAAEVRAALAASTGRVVVKPNVSAASADTGLFDPHDPAATALAGRILGNGKLVMVQPAIASVGRVGERSLIHFDDRFVHAIRKGPLLSLGGGLLGGDAYEETITAEQAPPDERAVARQALAVVRDIFAARGLAAACPSLYARVDLARDADDRPVLMELELLEPSYFLDLAPGAEQVFADAVMARLGA
ncbi:ATP-grasp domain-containing protein [Micropruina sp.]|uniref:ATP-grasp domain-containing protein n=1 Tax=Micropruina sp. TaxID=2737536 RepID=UPI0039E4965B